TKRALKYKMFVRDLLQQLVDEAFDDQPQVEAYLAVGGSTVNGCGSIKADLDLCIVAKNPGIVDRNAALSSDVKKENEFDQNREFHVDILRKTYTIFLKHQKKFQYLRFVDVARVPIISCKLAHPYDDGTLIEINCNNIAGVYNSHLLHYYAKVDERFPMMALVLKVWGAKENIINPMDGRVNAYTMQCMIIHFLQCATYPPILPNLWKLFPEFFGGKTPIPGLEFFRDLPSDLPDFHEMKNEKTVGELIIAFFDYYAKFDYAHDAISLRNARIFPRYHLLPEFQHWLFFIEEVYDLLTIPKNLKQAHVLQEIISKFKNAVDYYLMLRQIPIFRLICPEDVKKMASDEYNKLPTKTH
uniref:PAP-associated domain-containing protein n=1 Tax=Acrobeloides nanus TaxID=290746 RepID=A0A914EP21_9BILA